MKRSGDASRHLIITLRGPLCSSKKCLRATGPFGTGAVLPRRHLNLSRSDTLTIHYSLFTIH